MTQGNKNIPAVTSTFDIVVWLMDRALNDGEYLQPLKLHRLLYLSQAYFAIAFAGQKLMPATFVAEESGPVEPDVWRVYASGRPYIESVPLSERVEHFMDSVWRRFGAHSADYLADMVCSQPPYQDAYAAAPRSEISIAAMIQHYRQLKGQAARFPAAGVGVENVFRPRTMRNATGKPVSVQRWVPRGPKSGS